MAVKAVRDGYPAVTPYLIVGDGVAALEYYRQVFGAVERMRMPAPGGKIGHAEIEIGGSVVMLADEHSEMGFLGPRSIGGTPVSFHLYVEDVDARYAAAIAAGGKEMRAVQDQFYGDRSGTLEDPFGHVWTLATHVEDVTPEEMQRRMAAMGGHDSG